MRLYEFNEQLLIKFVEIFGQIDWCIDRCPYFIFFPDNTHGLDWLIVLAELRFYVPLETKIWISKMFFPTNFLA